MLHSAASPTPPPPLATTVINATFVGFSMLAPSSALALLFGCQTAVIAAVSVASKTVAVNPKIAKTPTALKNVEFQFPPVV
jgi:hypothetical protein